MQAHRSEYNTLTEDQRKDLIEKFDDHKKQMASRVKLASSRSRINLANQTLRRIESEVRCLKSVSPYVAQLLSQLLNLKACTGTEHILLTTPGTTNLPLKPSAFNTAGVENFLENGLRVDPQDLLGRMEGYAVQGLKGAVYSRISTP